MNRLFANSTALILAGGLGTRLSSVMLDSPKVLAPVCGQPFLFYLLRQLKSAGFGEVCLATGHLAWQIEEAVGSNFDGLKITYSVEHAPLGTGGAIRLAADFISQDTVCILNGDSYCGVDFAALYQTHAAHPAEATIALYPVPDAARYGRVVVDESGRIGAFLEKGPQQPGLINAGIYLVSTALLAQIPEGCKVSLEQEIFPEWVKREVLWGYQTGTQSRFIDIGTPESLIEAETFFGGQP